MDKCRALALIFSPEVIGGILRWPVFSLSSFHIVKQLVDRGIRPTTVIDVGANKGQFAVAASRLFSGCRVYAFEPLPDVFSDLVRKVDETKSIECFNMAVGARDETLELTVNSHRHSSSILELEESHKAAFPWAKQQTKVKVKVRPLDAIAEAWNLEPETLLKIDVQGFESQVLQGALTTLKRVKYVVLEASVIPLYRGEATFLELANFMANEGFEFLGPLDWLADPRNGRVLQLDALFQRRAS